jgi:plasmid stability protein
MLHAKWRAPVDRYDVHIRDSSVSEVLRETAEAHGRSVEEELSALVEKTYIPKAKKAVTGESSIQRLIRLGRGIEFEPPPRQAFVTDNPEL